MARQTQEDRRCLTTQGPSFPELWDPLPGHTIPSVSPAAGLDTSDSVSQALHQGTGG